MLILFYTNDIKDPATVSGNFSSSPVVCCFKELFETEVWGGWVSGLGIFFGGGGQEVVCCLFFFFPTAICIPCFFFHYSAVVKTTLRSKDKWLGQVMGLTIYCVYCSESQI